MDESILLSAFFFILILMILIAYEYVKGKSEDDKKIPFK